MSDTTLTIPGYEDLDIDLDRGFRTWHIDEIYKGDLEDRKARYVPNVNDAVISWSGGNYNMYYVKYVNPDTYVSDIELARAANEPDEVDMENVLVGQGVGAVNEAYRVYLNTKVTPFTLTVDWVLHGYGSGASHCKIFKGTDLTENGVVVSKYYDGTGTYQGENIPLEKVVDPDNLNKWVWAIKPGYCSQELDDGELLTAVIYSDAGIKLSTAKLVVFNTTLIRDSNAPLREITGLKLVSDSISPHDENVLMIPINLPVNSIMASAELQFNDGTTKPVQIDGSKCALNGLRGYISTVPGLRYPVTLSYFLSPGESTSIATPGGNPHISKSYWLQTSNPDRSNAVKLYVVPEFLNPIEGYGLKWYLHDLERNEPIDVTANVVLQTGTPFNGTMHGSIQKLMATIDLKTVGPQFMDYRFVQEVQILLRGDPDGTADPLWIKYQEGTGWYGEDVGAWSTTVDGYSRLDLCQGLHFSDEFLEKLYAPLAPMPDIDAGVVAPRPTHVIVSHGVHTKTIDVELFRDLVDWPVLLDENDFLRLDWVVNTASNTLYLATTMMPVKPQ